MQSALFGERIASFSVLTTCVNASQSSSELFLLDGAGASSFVTHGNLAASSPIAALLDSYSTLLRNPNRGHY